SMILANDVLNYSSLAHERSLILHASVGVGYDVPWRQVEAILLEAARRTPGLGTEPSPYVLIRSLNQFDVTHEIDVPCNDVPRMAQLYSALHRNVLDVFGEQGVQIMTPAYEGDPPEPKIPRHPPRDTADERGPKQTMEHMKDDPPAHVAH